MKHIPILFSTEMVQAILDGRKTMTRRAVKLPENASDPYWSIDNNEWLFFKNGWGGNKLKCPYGQLGDVLWVRESWRTVGGYSEKPDYSVMSKKDFVYKANEDWNGPFKPSIHMPKSACRIFLQVTDVRVERLREISEDDAVAEGANKMYEAGFGGFYLDEPEIIDYDADYRTGFKKIWQSINGVASWYANPWVWVISFKRIDKPVNF